MTEFWWFLTGWLSAAIPGVVFFAVCLRAGRNPNPPQEKVQRSE